MNAKKQPFQIEADPGSFKDPDARVYRIDGRLYRRFTPTGAARFQTFVDTGLAEKLVSQGSLIGWRDVPPDEIPELHSGQPDGTSVVEHPLIPFLSYCYEWSFEMLRVTALWHLDLLRECLEYGYILKDATPYNVQFIGTSPVFIDVASFVPWQAGTPWQAYAQFCRMFLNPLLLTGLTGVRFQPWLRGSLDGIDPEDLARLLAIRKKFRRGVMVDVVLQAWFNRRLGKSGETTERLTINASFGRKQMLGLVNRLEGTIRRLNPLGRRSQWVDYESHNSYGREAQDFKERLVDAVHRRIGDSYSNVLPLVMDMLNPSPDQGWNQAERGGMINRGQVDFVLCLALVHHLSIGGNIPFKDLTTWLARLAPAGVIELVPKSDPMVQGMLRWREHAYPWYTQTEFEERLQEHFRILERCQIPGTERLIYVFSK